MRINFFLFKKISKHKHTNFCKNLEINISIFEIIRAYFEKIRENFRKSSGILWKELKKVLEQIQENCFKNFIKFLRII